MMNVGTILNDNLNVTEQQGKSSSPGKDTNAKGAKICKNGSDYDITIAKSSHDKDKTKKIEDLENEKHELATQISIQKGNISSVSQVRNTLKANLKHREDKYLNDILQLQAKNKDLENVVCKMGKSTETLRLLTNEQRAYRDNIRKSGLGYRGAYVLSKANAKIPKLYSAYELLIECPTAMFCSEKLLRMLKRVD
ncbi:hypothetical protein Tco_0810999 [Tanacetum coccineum]